MPGARLRNRQEGAPVRPGADPTMMEDFAIAHEAYEWTW